MLYILQKVLLLDTYEINHIEKTFATLDEQG